MKMVGGTLPRRSSCRWEATAGAREDFGVGGSGSGGGGGDRKKRIGRAESRRGEATGCDANRIE